MAIQIVDGFQVNTASPIDNRIVASGSTARNLIPYKYEGLRVFDTSDSIPYVWLNNNWVNENATGVVASSTTANYIPKLSTSNIVINSIIYQNGPNIGISTTTPTAKLHVNGTVNATAIVTTDGSLISQISATNITSGTLPLGRLQGLASDGQIIIAGVTTPSWTSPSQLSVGTSSIAVTASNVSLSTSSTSTNYVLFSPNTTTGGPIKTNGSLMYDASVGNLISTGFMSGDSNNYTIRKKLSFGVSYLTGASHNVTIGTIGIASGVACLVEATFVAKNLTTGMGATTNYASNKIIGMFYNSGGTVAQVGSSTSVFSANNNSVSAMLDPGAFSVSGSNIQLYQVVTSSTANTYSVIVDYKITAIIS
jgi:hypothetical protein